MTRPATYAFLCLGFLAAGAAGAQDIAAGEEAYQDVCRNCHGPTAKGLASYPGLVGQEPEYLTDRLVRYRSGERIGPNSPLMIPHASELSDDDIGNIVAYIGTLG